jgi:Cu+-exporting ATPase
MGRGAKLKTSRLYVSGMTCAACSTRIEKVLQRTEGIHDVSVNLALAQASIQFEPRQVSLKSIIQKIGKLGYGAVDGELHPKAGFEAEIRSYRNRFISAAALSIPLLWAMMNHFPFTSAIWTPNLFQMPLFQLLLATFLQFGIGFPFYYGAYQALIQRTANMDVLVALSTSVAYFHSHYLLLHPPHHSPGHIMLYFDTIAMIMTAVLLGKLLESIAKGRALKDLNALYDLQVRLVRVIRRQIEEWIPMEQLRKGDRVLILAGEWISADGIVTSGCAEVDESLLTGESRTIVKGNSDRVYSGTRCLSGNLQIIADTNIEETRLSRIIALVEAAQNDKPLIQRKVDRMAAVFVPFMIICAAVTYFGWTLFSQTHNASESAIYYSLAVLLVACPCALGLATPVSILIATGVSAKSGVLFKEGRSLELLYRMDYVLMDKTGTLTEGKPQLQSIHASVGSIAYVLRMAAAVESHSSHPLARALVQAAHTYQLIVPEATQIREVPGNGMEGVVEGKIVRIGHLKWLQTQCLQGTELAVNHPKASAGELQLYVAINEQLAGTILLVDKLRPDAQEVVRKLKHKAQVWMVTGDLAQNAEIIAVESGIDQVYAGMLPEQKLELIRSLQRKGYKVAMIGDGINDAAALAAADIGIAMGSGTDAAMQAGDVVLVRNRLSSITDAISISRQTMRNIHQNLLFALLYNAITVPFAALGYLDPRVACVGMAASSVLVVSNALRLQRYKIGGREVGTIR